MDSAGQIKQLYWADASKTWFQFWSQPRQPCDVYAYCGPFGSCNEQTQRFCACLPGFKPKLDHDWNLMGDHSGGCVRKTQLQCQNNSLANGKSDKFLKIFNMVLPKKPQSVRVGSIAECESTCLNNCSCTAYAYENNACSVWVGDLLNLQRLAQDDTDGKTIYIKLAASDIPNPRNNKGTVIGGAVGGSAVFILLVGLFVVVYLRRRRTIKSAKAVEGDDLLTLLDPKLEGTADVEELSRICKVACWCIQDDETHRPSMSQVVQILEGLLEVTQSPVPRSLQVFADSQEHVIFFTDSSSNQSSQSQINNT
ncbi:hypothetical protein Patl1_02135 [Pistacia atlantica]|uniref:Uncharacterized protein n=1 Tax=Pistacia atlantica TaxID=434234 RepID=A0ACC1C6M3_9ROSI|nr:hypothetical protein Patl1_02135 [Pistacia atlantica]